ncbi:Hypothetical protein Deide_03831 [Deinococcus deserti VCD115]|uniref:Uncharacterized protein n=1 Tax=Deinococcus deserti (strain DSM 17065 / CIP 109153 / LMG 22923 / VCD115) TaxID=546414 RepID=C1CZV4_DEIDV|nr:Hypothetical protein Deide_03831 [Deinococcus deserti VCD115]
MVDSARFMTRTPALPRVSEISACGGPSGRPWLTLFSLPLPLQVVPARRCPGGTGAVATAEVLNKGSRPRPVHQPVPGLALFLGRLGLLFPAAFQPGCSPDQRRSSENRQLSQTS